MSSTVMRSAESRADCRRLRWCAALGTGVAIACGALWGCEATGRRDAPHAPQQVGLQSDGPRVIALGNLQAGPAPAPQAAAIAEFLFGTRPDDPLLLLAPLDVAVSGGNVLVADAALEAVLRIDNARRDLRAVPGFADRETYALSAEADGTVLICVPSAVSIRDASGDPQYALASHSPVNARSAQTTRITAPSELGAFRPAGAVFAGDAVWVANIAAHRLEIFDRADGAWRRSIGGPGDRPGRFAMPRGMARLPTGEIAVVDMLNSRVQVFTPDGEFARYIGRPGRDLGGLGQPRDIAVGPDGAVFITDAGQQCVHVFATDGTPLTRFGRQPSPWRLVSPGGITIARRPPPGLFDKAATVDAEYHVLVAEALHEPGVRAYAWGGIEEYTRRLAAGTPFELAWRREADEPRSTVESPHFNAGACTVCHARRGGELQTIPPALVDDVCLRCHDGTQAPADPHPIGRPATTDNVRTPEAFPTHNGRIGCLTCHEIDKHCAPAAQRPAENPLLLRQYEPGAGTTWCRTCHVADVTRLNPHVLAARASDTSACRHCHTQTPTWSDGTWRGAGLRSRSSRICLNCHEPHWDAAPRGHLGRQPTETMREWMRRRAASRGLPEHKRLLPLGENRTVTCYTCHNPHAMPTAEPIGTMARTQADREAYLRVDWKQLCSECHH